MNTGEYKKFLERSFFGDLAENRIGIGFSCNGKNYWISCFKLDFVPKEFREGYIFFQTTGHNHDTQTRFVRAFKDEFDLFENFIIEGKNLRRHVTDADIEIIDFNI